MTAAFNVNEASFSYGEKTVIDRLSAKIETGRFYGIMGPNGCGKSTLVDLLTGHRRPSDGTVSYLGKPIGRYAKSRVAREIALVPQNFYINFPFTAREIVMMGRYPHMPRFSAPSSADIRQVDQIMAETRTDVLKNRYINELSGGERQRVVFARALAQDASVLMLDEATSNLDVNHTLLLLNLAARRVQQEKTVVAVFQDINLAALYCDHLIFMAAGQVAVSGPADTVLTPETLATVFQVAAKVEFDDYCNAKQVVFRK